MATIQSDRMPSSDIGALRQWTIRPGKAELDPDGFARRRRWERIVLGIGVPVVLLALWEIAFQLHWIDGRYFPGPSRIAETAVAMIASGQWLSDLGATTRTLFVGGGIGFVVGGLVGILLSSFRRVRHALEPTLGAIYTIPKVALLPLLLLIFGLGDLPQYILVGAAIFFIAWLSVMEAVLEIPEGYREASEAFGVRGLQMFRHVVMPAILPAVFVALRIAIGQAVLVVITVEYLVGQQGTGFRIWHSWSLFAADQMYVGIVTVALLGFVLQEVVKAVGSVAVPWSSGRMARSK